MAWCHYLWQWIMLTDQDWLTIKILSYQYCDPMTKIRWFHDRLIFIMCIPIPGNMVFILKQGSDDNIPVLWWPGLPLWTVSRGTRTCRSWPTRPRDPPVERPWPRYWGSVGSWPSDEEPAEESLFWVIVGIVADTISILIFFCQNYCTLNLLPMVQLPLSNHRLW